MKSVQIRSFFWSVFSCIKSGYRKIRVRKNSVFGHFPRSDSGMKWVNDLETYFSQKYRFQQCYSFPTNRSSIVVQRVFIIQKIHAISWEISLNLSKSGAYSEPYQTSKMELFAKIVNDFQPLTIFAKSSVVDVWQGSLAIFTGSNWFQKFFEKLKISVSVQIRENTNQRSLLI